MRKVLVKELQLQKELVEKVSGTGLCPLSGAGGCCWGERLRFGTKSQGKDQCWCWQTVPSRGWGCFGEGCSVPRDAWAQGYVLVASVCASCRGIPSTVLPTFPPPPAPKPRRRGHGVVLRKVQDGANPGAPRTSSSVSTAQNPASAGTRCSPLPLASGAGASLTPPPPASAATSGVSPPTFNPHF